MDTFILLLVGHTYLVGYRNAEGVYTKRKIVIKRIYNGRNGITYIRAYCNLRKEDRTFRRDRMFVIQELNETAVNKVESGKLGEERPVVLKYTTESAPISAPIKEKSKAKKLLEDLFVGVMAVLLFLIVPQINKINLSDIFDLEYHIGLNHTSTTDKLKIETLYISTRSLKVQNRQSAKNISSVSFMQKKHINTVSKFYYRGIAVYLVENNDAKLYKVPKYGLSAISSDMIRKEINNYLFEKATGINDLAVESLYANADKDGDFNLSLREIKQFQNYIFSNFKYKNNGKALRPDEFVKNGGGDCEDWALMTCGLLTYWGYKSYLGTYSSPNNKIAHGVCLLYSASPPPSGYKFIHIGSANINVFRVSNNSLEEGYYIPIDYNVVGGYSNAMSKNWRLIYIEDPIDVYDTLI